MATDPSQTRRAFLTWLTAAGSAAIAAMLAVPGVSYVLDPVLRVTGAKGRWIRVAALTGLSKDHPVAAPVIGEQEDAWTKSPAVRLGTVWLRVLPDDQVAAWNAECPHLGCKIAYDDQKTCFACPCHDSSFTTDGAVLGGPSPRSMDPLETRVRDGQVEVRFVRFRAQIKEREEVG